MSFPYFFLTFWEGNKANRRWLMANSPLGNHEFTVG